MSNPAHANQAVELLYTSTQNATYVTQKTWGVLRFNSLCAAIASCIRAISIRMIRKCRCTGAITAFRATYCRIGSTPGALARFSFRPVRVVCQHYRMAEEQKLGGYVVFDMQFVEVGAPPFRPVVDTEENMIARSKDLQKRVMEKLARPHTPASALPKPQGTTGTRAIGFTAAPTQRR